MRIELAEFEGLIDDLVKQIGDWPINLIVCLSRGGLIPGAYLAQRLNISGEFVVGVRTHKSEGNYQTELLLHLDNITGNHVLVVDDVSVRGILIHNTATALEHMGATVRTAVVCAAGPYMKPDYVGAFTPEGVPTFFWER